MIWRIFLLLALVCPVYAAPQKPEQTTLGGRTVSVWRPAGIAGKAPLVLFSHGFHGSGRQSSRLMRDLAQSGFLVLAPNHKDAAKAGRPDVGFGKVKQWTDQTYRDRAVDLIEVYRAARKKFDFDPNRVVLVGHSLGGYTVLGLAGAWPSWRTPELKPVAVIALSPYSNPFVQAGTLKNLAVPVLYQAGSRDPGVAPFVRRRGGTYDQTPEPKMYVELRLATHFAYTDLAPPQVEKLVSTYNREFLERYVYQKQLPQFGQQRPGVARIAFKP